MSNSTKSLDYESLDNVSVASDRTQSSTAPVIVPAIIYIPRWPHKIFMKNVPAKLSENTMESIVDRFAAVEMSDLGSPRSVVSNGTRQAGSQSSSEWESYSTQNTRSDKTSSWSDLSSDGGPFSDSYTRPPTELRDQRSLDSNQSSSNHSSDTSSSGTKKFYPRVRSPPQAFNEKTKYLTFEHRFQWSENTENLSPWVIQRTKEITNHVNGSFETRKHEIPETFSEKTSKDSKTETETPREDNSESDDDGITYEMASALCDSLIEPGKAVTSENQCSSNDMKWTRLYQDLVNNGQL